LDYTDLIINWGIIALISTMISGSMLFILYKRALPQLMLGFQEGIISSMRGSDNQKLSVASRLDNTVKKKLAADITDPSNPLGAALSLLPETRDYISDHPEQVGGLVNLITTIPNLLNVIGSVKNMQQVKKDPVDVF
jgi:hypothetical protein